MDLSNESYLLLLLRVQFIRRANVEPDSLLRLTLIEWPRGRCRLSWAVLTHSRFLLICLRGTPPREVAMDSTTGAGVAFFHQFLVQFLSPLLPFFPSAAQKGGINIERTGAPASGGGFHSIGQPLPYRSGRETHTRSNLIRRESLAL